MKKMRICVYLQVLFVLHSGCEFRRRELQFERAPLTDWWWGRHGACAACQTDRMPSDGPCNTRAAVTQSEQHTMAVTQTQLVISDSRASTVLK